MFKKKTFDWNKFPAKRHALIIVWFGYFYILVGTGWRSSSWDCCARPSWGCPTHCATGDWPRKNIIWQEWQEYNMTEINLLLSDMLLNLNCFIWLLFVLWLTPDDKVPVLHEIPVHVHHDVAYPTVPLMTSLHTSPTSAPTTSIMQWSCSTPASSPPRGGRACVPVQGEVSTVAEEHRHVVEEFVHHELQQNTLGPQAGLPLALHSTCTFNYYFTIQLLRRHCFFYQHK